MARMEMNCDMDLQNRRISGASAIHERARKMSARPEKAPGFFWHRASRTRSCIALAPLIRLFCRLILKKRQDVNFSRI